MASNMIRNAKPHASLRRSSSSNSFMKRALPSTHSSKIDLSRATGEMMRHGVHTIVSLGSGELSPEIECMASEFSEITRGEIKSVLCPLSLKLKEETGKKPVKITTLKTISDLMKSVKGSLPPFMRFDKVKILYIPLFKGDLADDELMTFSLIDTSVIDEDKQTISELCVKMNKMSMSELSMSFSVRRNDIDCIQFQYSAGTVPVEKRSYAFVMVGFYVHEDFAPAQYRVQTPIVLEIGSVDTPIDVNKTSSIKMLCDEVQTRVKNSRGKLRVAALEGRKEINKRMKGLIIDDHPAETEQSDEESEIPLEGPHVQQHQLTMNEITTMLPRNIPYVRKECVILDTGAPNHWLYNPDFVGDKMLHHNGDDIVTYSTFPSPPEIKLGGYWVKLNKALMGGKDDIPLISYTQLLEDGIVDCIQSISKDKSVLKLGNKTMFILDHSSPGRMVFESSNLISSATLGS